MRNRKTGKMAPIDVVRGEKGNCHVDLTDMSYAIMSPFQGGFVNHFGTCPQAAKFKGRGKK